VVMPTRTEGGQRLYSDLDIQRLSLLRRLGERGHSIGRIAALSVEALAQLDPAAALDDPVIGETSSTTSDDTDAVREASEAALRAIRRLDGWGLQTLLERAAVTFGAPDFLDRVAKPVLEAIGRGWAEGTLSVAQEHLATAVFKRVLNWLLGVYEVKGPAPRLVVATPPGERHEMGALMVAVTAAAERWSVTYLGPDLPVADLLEAARQSDANAVAISTVHAPDRAGLEEAIRTAREGLPRGIPLLLGGAAIPELELEPSEEGILVVDNLTELRRVLAHLPSATL
jgi:MerR family transcriptional regulator, light-induced transcriptional regulator